mgnify:CR=1 FL=1
MQKKAILTITGISIGIAMLSCSVVVQNAEARHLGKYGSSFQIEEPDFLTSVETKLRHLEASGEIAKINNMWAIINTGGSANLRHQHGNSTISGAYYVRAPRDSGDIVFYDPRPAPVYSHPLAKTPNALNAMVNSISPVEGGLILFPSYLDHSVNPNLSKEERIVISFNISFYVK